MRFSRQCKPCTPCVQKRSRTTIPHSLSFSLVFSRLSRVSSHSLPRHSQIQRSRQHRYRGSVSRAPRRKEEREAVPVATSTRIAKTFVVFVHFVVQKIQEWIFPVLLSRFSPLQVTLTTKLQKNPPFQNSSIPTLQRKNTHKTVVSWVF